MTKKDSCSWPHLIWTQGLILVWLPNEENSINQRAKMCQILFANLCSCSATLSFWFINFRKYVTSCQILFSFIRRNCFYLFIYFFKAFTYIMHVYIMFVCTHMLLCPWCCRRIVELINSLTWSYYSREMKAGYSPKDPPVVVPFPVPIQVYMHNAQFLDASYFAMSLFIP